MNKFFFKASTLATIVGLALTAGTANAKGDKVNTCSKFNGTKSLNWVDGDPAAIRVAVQTLLNARTHGLDPKDYQARKLINEGHAIVSAQAGQISAERISQFNFKLTRSVTCYLQNVKGGRLNPHGIYKQIWLPRQKFNAAIELTEAFENQTVDQLLANAAPQNASYQNLRTALAQLRSRAFFEAGSTGLPKRLSKELSMGSRHELIPTLRARLQFLGDLAAANTSAGAMVDEFSGVGDKNLFDVTLADALTRFQSRHGLSADGVLNTKTLKALRTSMPVRIAQIELAMERERWYPRNPGKRVVKVNIPQFQMQASAPDAQGDIDTLNSKVIVGRPGRSYTPLFAGAISRIEFSPKWYVPQSFGKRKILPRLRRDPGYLKRKEMEIRLPGGKLTQRVTDHNLSLIAQGRARLQQRSGPKNALGRVKFILPNSRAIFMHDTNRPELFAKDHRALSLGCVRLEKPLALAELILADNPKWNAERIEKASKSKRTLVANTTQDTIVMLAYQTAVASDNGQLSFFGDLYKMDAKAMKHVSRWSKPTLTQPENLEQLAAATFVNG